MGSDVLPSYRSVTRVVAIVVAAALSLYLIYLLRKPISWIVIATFLAVALAGPVNLLERHVRRGVAIAIVYLGVILAPLALAAVLVPPIVTQANDLVGNAPRYAHDVTRFVQRNTTLDRLERKYDITSKLEQEAAKLPSKIGSAAGTLRDLGIALVSSLFSAITILILSIFLMGSGPRWIEALIEQQPASRAERLERALRRIANAIGNYVGGVLLQATIAGITTFIVLTILGVDFAGPLSVVVALFDLIPLVGATVAALFVGLVTLFTDFPTATIVWTIWAVVYQQVENNVIQPQIQRRAVDIQPFFVLVSVLFGSTLFGIVGALLAIPAAASIQIALREYLDYRRESQRLAGAAGGEPVTE